jgi:uncharacterized protein YhbP (UPF0306 family)
MESTIPISELLARLTQQSDQVYFIFDPQQTRFLYLTDAKKQYIDNLSEICS